MESSKLLINAKYEIKIQMRGWFFRIILGLAIALLVLFNSAVFFEPGRTFSGLSSYPVYANLSLMTILGTVLLIFSSTDLSKRNRITSKVDAFYIRSMTNAEYLFGQSVGLFLTFIILIFLSILISLVVTVLNIEKTTPVLQPFIYYPLLIWLPCFVYTLGLSSLLMRWIKNQAIVIVLLFAYLLFDLIYLSDKASHIFRLSISGFFIDRNAHPIYVF